MSDSTRTCRGCDAEIVPHHRERNVRIWCSDRCRIKRLRVENTGYAEATRARSRERSRANYTPRPKLAGNCVHCAEPFLGKAGRRYCSQSCVNAASNRRRTADGRKAEHSALRRAMERGAKVQGGRRTQVLERDQWMCHLCDKPTNREATYPAPDYPVIDHVIPLARGGEHGPSNWRTAHNRCNSQRRDMSVEDYRARYVS